MVASYLGCTWLGLGVYSWTLGSYHPSLPVSWFSNFPSHTRGIINTYGVYQTFYQADFLRFESESTISWIGSVQAALLYLIGAAAGPIFDAGHMRALIWSGTILSVLGMMLTSIAKTYWQVILSQGVLVGLGTGCLFVGAISIIPQYFTTKKIFAYGITSTGSSIGEQAPLPKHPPN